MDGIPRVAVGVTAMYYCGNCGNVTVNEGYCAGCGGSDLYEYDHDGDDAGGEYVCDECGDSFDSEHGLRSHSRVHS